MGGDLNRPYGIRLIDTCLAQSVEHQTLNLRVRGSSPLVGDVFFNF